MIKRKEELIMNNVKYDGVYYPVREVSDLKDMIVKSAELFRDRPAYLQKDKPGGDVSAAHLWRVQGKAGCPRNQAHGLRAGRKEDCGNW